MDFFKSNQLPIHVKILSTFDYVITGFENNTIEILARIVNIIAKINQYYKISKVNKENKKKDNNYQISFNIIFAYISADDKSFANRFIILPDGFVSK